jgi:signal transduction histidine kinase
MSKPLNVKVLLVDDEERLLAGLRRRLSARFDLITTTSPLTALEYLAHDSAIAAIVADMQMPEMSGVELLKRAQDIAPNARRLMLTGNSDAGTAIAAINDGKVMRFLQKPCEAEVLAAAIEQAIAERRFQDQRDLEPIRASTASAFHARHSLLNRLCAELKSPLAEIAAFTAQIEERPADFDDEASGHMLQQLQINGERVSRFASRMLEFSRLMNAPATGGSETAEVIHTLSQQIDVARKAGAARGITISLDSLRREVAVVGRMDDLAVAFRELLSNAVRFSGQNGHISVAVKTERHCVRVRIADTGCGVAPATLERLQSASADDARATGHGLGLALVATIASVSNARFSIGPAAGGGTEAMLSFKRAPLEQTTQSPDRELRSILQSKSVLCDQQASS